jgi:AcrR family transcriptional regulator
VTAVDHHEDRALRADAQRNLRRVLDAARAVFAEQGAEASVTAIAERAGVGVATIFRRFPTKDDLLGAILEQRLDELVDAADAALVDGGLRAFMTAAVASFVGDHCLCDVAGTDLFARDEVRSRVEELDRRLGALLARARREGEVRADVTAADISVLVTAVARAGLRLEPSAPGAWRRPLGIVLDGLRPEAAHPLGHRPLTRRQVAAARGARPA